MHEGHRSRLKKKFLLNDMDYFEDHEALELILFYAIPRKNTNDVAHNLLKKFGSVDQILDAPIKILQEVEGVGESAAILIKSISSIIRIYLERKYSGSENYLSLKDDLMLAHHFLYIPNRSILVLGYEEDSMYLPH